MARCAKCGTETAGGAKFCKACGAGVQTSGHDEKKARVLAAETGSRKTPAIIGAAVVVLVLGFFAYTSYGSKTGSGMPRPDAVGNASSANAVEVAAEGNEIRIPESSIQGSKANYYRYNAGGKMVTFFVLRASDGAVRVALDACTACYRAKQGYRQDGDAMICNNCGMGFRSVDVGKITGGCSPIPVEKKLNGTILVLKASDIAAGATYF